MRDEGATYHVCINCGEEYICPFCPDDVDLCEEFVCDGCFGDDDSGEDDEDDIDDDDYDDYDDYWEVDDDYDE